MSATTADFAAGLFGRTAQVTRAAARIRFARATDRLDQMVAFYRDGIGLPVLETFCNHAGYSGVILGMPGGAHLEFTQHAVVRRAARPDADDLLVLYFPSSAKVARLRRRLEYQGHVCVPPVNPYWMGRSVTFEDPDRWRVVLCDGSAN